MEEGFWHERWERGEIGFHRSELHWALLAHWKALGVSTNASVLVPLCGKSRDLHWLAEQGHQVTGVELNALAVDSFFKEWPTPNPPAVTTVEDPKGLTHYHAGSIELICGNFFDVDIASAGHEAFYDRAALIAMPAKMRGPYLDHLHHLLHPGAVGLLVAFEYQSTRNIGPPFSVFSEEITSHQGFEAKLLERKDVLSEHPGMRARGVRDLHEAIYVMRRR